MSGLAWTKSADCTLVTTVSQADSLLVGIAKAAKRLGRNESGCMSRWYKIKRGDVAYPMFPAVIKYEQNNRFKNKEKIKVTPDPVVVTPEKKSTVEMELTTLNTFKEELPKEGIFISDKKLLQMTTTNLKSLVIEGISDIESNNKKQLVQILKTIYK